MPTYVTLWKLTDQGIKEIKNAPQRIAANTKALEAAGGKTMQPCSRPWMNFMQMLSSRMPPGML